MNVLKIGLALAAAMVVTGCAALSQKEGKESYGSGQIVYFEVNNPSYKYGEDAIKFLEEKSNIGSKVSICGYLKDDYCNPEYRNNLALHNGNIKVSMTKILKMNVLTTKDVQVKKYDIIKAKFLLGDDIRTNVAIFLSVADPSDCKWDGTGVVCKSGWDYRKDLPIAMR